MAKRTLNFDNFMAEKNREYVEVVVYNETYKVAREIPAYVPVMMARANESTDKNEVVLSILRAGDIMFGKETIEKFCEKGMSSDMLSTLIQKTFNLISSTDVDGDDIDDDSATYDDTSSKIVAEGKKPKK